MTSISGGQSGGDQKNEQIFYTIEKDGTTFSVGRALNGSYFFRTSGRINCTRSIQRYQAAKLMSGTVAIAREYIRRGAFVLLEGNIEYVIEPSIGGWLIKCGEQVKQVKEETVGDIIWSDRTAEEVLEESETVLIGIEVKQVLTSLSDMLDSGVFNAEIYENAKKYLEQTGDEHVKDMLKIVRKHFRERVHASDEVEIQVIE